MANTRITQGGSLGVQRSLLPVLAEVHVAGCLCKIAPDLVLMPLERREAVKLGGQGKSLRAHVKSLLSFSALEIFFVC